MRIREMTIAYLPRPGTANARRRIHTPEDASALVRGLSLETVEVFELILLDTKHRLIAMHRCGRGTLDSCLVHPRDVLKAALLANAAAYITAHNHPSGDPTPSPDDAKLFARLESAGAVVGIAPLDHVIVGHDSYWSNRSGHVAAFTPTTGETR